MGYRQSVYRTFALITQVGLSMLTPIFLCVFAGQFLENRFHIPIFIPLVILGVFAGFRNCYYLVRHANEDPEEYQDEDEDDNGPKA